ncbi:uncharacterized protein LOC144374025 [Ictidomys tridecemlineatus]
MWPVPRRPLAGIREAAVGWDPRGGRWLGSARRPLAGIREAAVGWDPRGGRWLGSARRRRRRRRRPARLRRRRLRAGQRRTGAAGAGPALERPPGCSMCARRGLLWLPRRSLFAALFFFLLSSLLLYSVYVAPGIGSCFEYPQSLV